jgi:hypothetical protein
MKLDSGGSTVAELRLRTTGLDPLVARLHFDRLLAETELHPPSLSPAAILVVRSLEDPRPRTLRLGAPGPSDAWRRAASAAVQDKLRRAARPRLGQVPDGAEAVLFADRAELYTCLVLDWWAGRERWWWRLLEWPAPPLPRLVEELAREPEHLPALVSALAEERALGVLHAVDPPALALLAVELCRRFALFGLSPVAEALARRPRAVEAAARQLRHFAAPWSSFLKRHRAAEPLAPAAELMAGIAVTLAASPTLARSRAFSAAAEMWLETVSESPAETDDHALPASPVMPRAERSAQRKPHHAETEAAAVRAAPPPPVSADPPRPLSRRPDLLDSDKLAPAPVAPASETEVPAKATSLLRRSREPTREPLLSAPPETSRPPPQQRLPVEPPPVEVPREPMRLTETDLGGLFFLVNLALYLDLYGDFARPRHHDLALPLFDFVALLGRELGAGSEHDPLWLLLAELAGRPPEQPPGGGFVPPASWVLPDGWLTPFLDVDGDWTLYAPPGRLQIVHSAGFIAADLPFEPSAPSLTRWLSWVAPYARARLQRAVACDDLSHLWRRRARVFCTDTRIDVEFSLDEHPLEVRIAGLDRDPGWLPSAGRDVRFHFR